MGLFYLFPSKLENSDRTILSPPNEGKQRIVIKSYGPPYIFWAYYVAIMIVLLAMILAIYTPCLKLIETGDLFNQVLGVTVLALFPLLAIGLLTILLLEKRIEKVGDSLTLSWAILFLPIYRKRIKLKDPDALSIGHFMDSANMARMQVEQGQGQHKAFQNKGYFELFALSADGQKVLVDRHSLRTDLEALKTLLNSV